MNELADPMTRVLIVEDNEATSNALWVQFHIKSGYVVDQAATLAEARVLLSESPNAVLLDLKLPDGDGEDLIDEIRDRCPRARILVVTGHPPGGRRMDAIAGRTDYVAHKPYCMDSLLSAVTSPTAPTPGG